MSRFIVGQLVAIAGGFGLAAFINAIRWAYYARKWSKVAGLWREKLATLQDLDPNTMQVSCRPGWWDPKMTHTMTVLVDGRAHLPSYELMKRAYAHAGCSVKQVNKNA